MKRVLSFFCAICLLASCFVVVPIKAQAATAFTEAQFTNKIAALKKEYPHEKYWSNKNGEVESGTYKGTSLAGSTKCSSSYYYSSNCGTFVLSGTEKAYQCHGFALLLGHKIFGSNANNWTKYTSKTRQIYAGDVIRIDANGNGVAEDYDHTIFVYKVTSSRIYYADCNKTGPCQINWKGEMTLTSLRSKLLYIRHLADNVLTGSGAETPVLSVKYHANGGTIVTDHNEYKVTEEVGINMRTGAGTGYDKIKTLAKGTTFRVKIGETKAANGYTWGKTTVDKDTGWVVVSDYVSKLTTVVGAKGYYLNSSVVYKGSSSAVHVHKMTYGETSPDGLYNAFTFGLTREGYTFQGWSLATEGGTVIDQNQSLKPEDIVPDLKNGSKTVTMYAIWEENIPEHSHDYEEIVTAPTCTEDGYTTFTCSCGDTYIDEVVESLGHIYEETHFDGNPGYTVYTCSRCGDSYTIEDEIQEALEITNTAGNQHVIKNSAISFTVELSRTEGVTYQWQRCKNGVNWTNVSYNGNKTKTVTFDATSWAQYPFRCVITDASGNKLYTDTYTYTLIEPPVAPNITSNPKDVYLISGNTATFSVEAVGSDLTYQWWRSKNGGQTWGEYTGTGGQTSSISLKVYSGQEYLYMCEVKDGYGNTLKTKVVQPHLITPVKITSQPSVVVEDGKATFSFTATGDVRTYQWERLKSNGWVDANYSSYEGFNTTTMSTTVTGIFRCRITDLAGNVTYTNQVAFTK